MKVPGYNKHLNKFRGVAGDILAIFVLLFVINNYTQRAERTINADGVGYYDYLPALFIHHDLDDSKISETTSRKALKEQYYVKYGETYLDKYTCGTAILISPFFLAAHIQADAAEADGYSPVYQRYVFYAAVFYLFLFAFFFRKFLETYSIKAGIIFACQLFAIVATPVLNYVNDDAAFSHVYSLFAITAFLYCSRMYLREGKAKQLYFAFALLGLIFLLRQVNVMVVLFVPFLADSYPLLLQRFKSFFKDYRTAIIAFVILLFTVNVQCMLWYIQTGEWIVYSYGTETFIFSESHIIDFLFSYQRGMFVYAPVLLVCVPGIIYWLVKGKFWTFFTWFVPLLLIVFVFSSWYVWFYGASFGCRPMIEFVPLFLLPFALFMNQVRWYLAASCIVVASLAIPVGIVQTWQYKQFVLHWTSMNKEKYWEVFLETDEQFRGYLWKPDFWLTERWSYTPLDSMIIGDREVGLNTFTEVWRDTIEDWSPLIQASILQLEFDGTFTRDMTSTIAVQIKESGSEHLYYEHQRPAMHFAETGLGHYQRGRYNFQFEPKEFSSPVVISVLVAAYDNRVSMRNARIRWIWYHPMGK
ncbi:MAG TPA: hypothetical protein VK826_09845 [Bacteroidia bacterium]|nr:hypothetical protein [Bacteroidia bacterium]